MRNRLIHNDNDHEKSPHTQLTNGMRKKKSISILTPSSTMQDVIAHLAFTDMNLSHDWRIHAS